MAEISGLVINSFSSYKPCALVNLQCKIFPDLTKRECNPGATKQDYLITLIGLRITKYMTDSIQK